MTSSVSSTPRNNHGNAILVRTPRRLCRRSLAPGETPECSDTPASSRRRTSKEKFNEISNLLTVAVRIRPMNVRELSCTTVFDTISVNNNELTVKGISSGHIGVGISHTFQYDHVFWSVDREKSGYVGQKDVFVAIGKPLLENAFKGYNACLFAYGQTGSGKSYSMMGEHCNIDNEDNETAGIIPRFCYDLFERIAELPPTSNASVEVSYFEIYNERIFDLLAISNCALERRTPLKVREHPVWGPYVVDLSPHTVKSFDQLRNLLQLGNKFRATAATVANEKSSRSHSIVSIELSVCEINNDGADSGRRSKISLVDLAGSERVGSTSSSDDRHREGVSINQSLLTLGKVISSLADPKRTNNFIPYRESTLTWLLRESLGGNSLTSMLATITPASSNVDETLATLRYACQARSIVNRAYVNENPHDRLIRELRAEVERLRALRQDYERQSVTPITAADDTSMQEMEELRQRLSETEHNLENAQKQWEQRFLETKQKQLEELAEAERKKQELESHVRVMSTLDQNIAVSPYKSNFLEELEDVLEGDTNDAVQSNLIEDANKWCKMHNLNSLDISWHTPMKSVIIKNLAENTYAICSPKYLENRNKFNNTPKKFLASLDWQMEEIRKPITKDFVHKHWQQICNATIALKPATNEDEHLRSAYAQLNQALTAFDVALNKSKFRTKSAKSVKFRT